MNTIHTPPPLPHQRPPAPGIPRAMLWGLIGLGFAVIQFAVSEAAFQIAQRGGPDSLYDLSNTIAWPAADVYDRVEAEALVLKLKDMSLDSSLDPDRKEKVLALLERQGDASFEEEAWAFADEEGVEVYPGVVIEYLIYGGTCLMWGVVVGLGGFGLSFFYCEAEGS